MLSRLNKAMWEESPTRRTAPSVGAFHCVLGARAKVSDRDHRHVADPLRADASCRHREADQGKGHANEQPGLGLDEFWAHLPQAIVCAPGRFGG